MFLRPILLAGMLAFFSFSTGAEAQVWDNDDDNGVMSISYIMGGAKWYDLDDLNDLMDAAGYGTFRDTFGYVGVGMKMSYRRFLTDLQLGAVLTSGREDAAGLTSADLAGLNGFLNVGLALFSTENTSLFPYIGIGGESLALSLVPDTTVTLDEVLTNPGVMTAVTTNQFLFNFGVGGDWMLPLFETGTGPSGITLGFRAGYMWAPTVNNFRYRDLTISGELVDLSGPYATLTIGWGRRFRNVDTTTSPVFQLSPFK